MTAILPIPHPRVRHRVATQGLEDAHELVEIVRECDAGYVWSTVSQWGHRRAAIAALVLAAAHHPDRSLTPNLAWTLDLADRYAREDNR